MGTLTSVLQLTALRWPVQKFVASLVLRNVIALLAVPAMVLLPSQAVVADESLEYGVKAAFLYKFGSYVEWPAKAFNSPTSPINLCLLGGPDQFSSSLEKIINGEGINGRSVVVRQIKKAGPDTSSCHILYISAPEMQHSAQIIESVRGNNVLTVSDGGSEAIIDFIIVNNHVRFNIDDEAAAQNGLVISSRLLSLAVNVKRRASKGE